MRLVIVFCFAVLFFAVVAQATVVGIDFGTEWTKSHRKDPALVGFSGGDRVVGEAAATAAGRRPDSVLAHIKFLLGQPYNDETIQRFRRLGYSYDFVKMANGNLGVRIEGEEYSMEELGGMMFAHVREFIEVINRGPVKDCVITVPAWYTHAARLAVENAARLAGLNVLSLIHDHAAVALHYGVQGALTAADSASGGSGGASGGSGGSNKTIVFVDVGSGATQVSVAQFNQSVPPAVHVLGVAWDTEASGAELDATVVDVMARAWNSKHADGKDIRTVPRAMARLRKQAGKVREVLSANSETPIFVEALLNDEDLATHLTRADFEVSAQPVLDRIAAVVEAALTRAGVEREQVDGVVLFGGGSRVPAVKATLQRAMRRETLNLTLNADEAAALGAGFFAARLSPTFKVKQVHLFDVNPRAVVATLDDASEPIASFDASARIPSRRFHNDSRSADFAVHLRYTAAPTAATPLLITSYSVEGVAEAAAKLNSSGPAVLARLQLRMGHNGIAELLTADAQRVELAGEEDESGAAAAATDSKKKPPVPRVTLRIKEKASGVHSLTTDELLEASRRLKAVDEREKLRHRTADARNALEALIYAAREEIETAPVLAVTIPEQIAAIESELSTASDWLSDADESTTLEQFETKTKALMALLNPIRLRVSEREKLPSTFAAAQNLLGGMRAKAEAWNTTKPWLSQEDRDDLARSINKTEAWFVEKYAEQSAAPAHEAPVITSDMIRSRIEMLNTQFARLDRRRPPPPPPKPKTKTASGSEQTKTEEAAGEEKPAADEKSTDQPEQQAGEGQSTDNSEQQQDQQQQQPVGQDGSGAQEQSKSSSQDLHDEL